MRNETQHETQLPVPPGHTTLKLASYQPRERRNENDERRTDARRATLGERRTAGQRVLRALFGI